MEYQIRPSVSNATINDNLGVTEARGTVAGEFAGTHNLRVKLVSATQLSSTLMMSVPSFSNSIILCAYYYRNTRHFYEFACVGNFLEILYRIPSSCFMNCMSLMLVMSTSSFIFSRSVTNSALVIGSLLSIIS